MRPGGSADSADCRISFDSTTLCCTFLPELPNFLVGRILADREAGAARGRRSVEARLRKGVAVTPLGLSRPPVYGLLYRSARGAFGRSKALHCPHHLAGGYCGIWEHRSSICATWFCKHDRGAVGKGFWTSLNALLGAVETGLARWCMLESGLDARTLARLAVAADGPAAARPLDHHDIDGSVDPEGYAELWGERLGREREFYEECGRLVEGLEWSDVAALCGAEVRLLAEVTRHAYRELLSHELPARLGVGEFVVAGARPGASVVVSYSEIDPLSLPPELLEALPLFDGRPVGQALREIERRKGLRLDPELLVRLCDFGILVPASRRAR